MPFTVTGKVQSQKGSILIDMLKAARISSRLSFGRLVNQEKQSVSSNWDSRFRRASSLPVASVPFSIGVPPWRGSTTTGNSCKKNLWLLTQKLLQTFYTNRYLDCSNLSEPNISVVWILTSCWSAIHWNSWMKLKCDWCMAKIWWMFIDDVSWSDKNHGVQCSAYNTQE